MVLFINREEELRDFNKYYNLSKNRLFPVVLYGQRRVGKTKLMKEFTKNKKSIYFFVNENKNSSILLEDFNQILRDENLLDEFTKLETWDKFIHYLVKKCSDYVIIFDEFQNFKIVDNSVFSIFQYYIDEFENQKNVMIVFLGSIVGLIREIFENQKSPLFGRVKAFYHLKQFSFEHTIKLCNEIGIRDFKKIIELYSIFDGFPRYYILINDYKFINKTIDEIIEGLVLKESSPLRNEVLNTLKLNFGQGKLNYYSILEAIAYGNTTSTKIANYIGKDTNSTNFFLNELKNYYGFIKRNYPVTEIENKNTKITNYSIENNFFDFYFNFIHKNINYIEFGDFKRVETYIRNNLVHLIAKKFEDICRELIYKQKNYVVGSWWNRQGEEIDICGFDYDGDKLLFGECKWQNNVDARNILNRLISKTENVSWRDDKRVEEFVIFAKGFKESRRELREISDKYNCTFYDLKDIEKVFIT